MSKKFHVNSKGEAGECQAKKNCPFGGFTGLENHFNTVEEARNFYETSKASETLITLKNNYDVSNNHFESNVPTLSKDTFISIVDNDFDIGKTTIEGFPEMLGNDLEPGIHHGFYYNEETEEDESVLVTVNSDRSVLVQPSDPTIFENSVSVEVPLSPEKEKFLRLNKNLVNYSEEVESNKFRKGLDPKTLKEVDIIMSDLRELSNLHNSDRPDLDLEHLEDFQEEMNRNGHLADASGNDKSAETWWKVSEKLADVLNS